MGLLSRTVRGAFPEGRRVLIQSMGMGFVHERNVDQADETTRFFPARFHYLDFQHFRNDCIFGIEKNIPGNGGVGHPKPERKPGSAPMHD